jgi:hypothetical protein
MAQGDEMLLTQADDGFHPGGDIWQTEGSWWSFNVPERRIGGWIYHLTRLGQGVASGGVWVWDDKSASCFEAPYYLNHYHQQFAAGSHDLNDFCWPDGTCLQTIKPLEKYRLAFEDRDLIALELDYQALTVPYVSAAGEPRKPFRLEQPCRVTGDLRLHGEHIVVDCIGMRDHSWGIRREGTLAPTPLAEQNLADAASRSVIYLFGTASAQAGFFVMATHGYLMRDGVRRDLARIEQIVTRDPASGQIAAIIVTGSDDTGREFAATGTPLSMIMRPSNSGLGMIYTIRWDFDGATAWGELQDIWPVDLWSAYRRYGTAL